MALNYENPSPLDTYNEHPSFVPEQEVRATHAAAQQLAWHRDQLVTENSQLRREVETLHRAQRELDEATRNGDGSGRRLTLLREALARKDSEILALKTHHVGRDRAIHEAKEVVDRLRRERADLEDRLRSRDGVFQSIEAERATLSRALEGARQEREQTASALMQADGTAHEWQRYADDLTRERDEARRQLGELANEASGLRSALQVSHAEQQYLLDSHAREIAAVRAELSAVIEHAREESEAAHDALVARFEAARATHAMTLRAMEDEQTEELAAERAARIVAEEATLAQKRTMNEALELSVESMRAEHLEAVGAIHQEYSVVLRAADEEATAARSAAAAESAESLQAMAETHAAELHAAVETHAAELHATAETHAAELQATAETHAAELQATAESLQAMVETHATELQAMAETHATELHATVEGTADALRAAVEEAATAQGRAMDLERELEATREALGTYATDTLERIETAERVAREAQGYRDRYARKLATAMEQIRMMRAETVTDARAQGEVLQSLGGMVGQMTARMVLRETRDIAQRSGRATPKDSDVDAAIAAMTDALSADVADELWAHRDAFVTASCTE